MFNDKDAIIAAQAKEIKRLRLALIAQVSRTRHYIGDKTEDVGITNVGSCKVCGNKIMYLSVATEIADLGKPYCPTCLFAKACNMPLRI